MSTPDTTSNRRAITVRLEPDLYDAFADAAELRGVGTMTDAARQAIVRYIAESATDVDLAEEVKRKQAALRARAERLGGGSPLPRRSGQAPRTVRSAADAKRSTKPKRRTSAP